ncbi:MAG: TraB/GumN family protein [Muribaculaceae bacterium]|nr:TraB/GumN family protein [Muribaculaceae bacterium]
MKKILFTLLVTIVAIGSGKAQLLYKVQKDGSNKTSYILGTHHFAPVELLDSIDGLDVALQAVDKMYGEVDMSQMNNPMEMMKYSNKMIAPPDSTLNKILSAAELDTLTTTWDKLSGGKVPLKMMYAMKPNVVSTSLMAMIMQQHFPDKDFQAPGIDQTMQDRAGAEGKEVAGLETVAFQLDMLFGEPISEQKESLMDAVRDGGESQVEETIRLTNAYMSRDLDTVSTMMTDPELMTPEKADAMIYNRNANWVEILVPEMQQKSIMVVVGAGHLPTERGLLNLLRQAGYTVTPVD